MKLKTAFLLAALVCLLVVGVVAAVTGPDASWNVIAGGGGKSVGGNIEIQDTIGQPIVGVSSGGVISLEAGFWQVVETIRYSIFLPAISR